MPDPVQAPSIFIPFVPHKLAAETRALGEQLGARFVSMTGETSYWDLLTELWPAEDDFIVMEEDVLPTVSMIRDMWACREPWCSGTYGRWYWALLCARTDDAKPCGEPRGRCGQSDMSPEKAARIAACPLRLAGRKVLISDSWLACVKFGSIRSQIPDLLVRASAHSPGREWWTLDRALFRILNDDELLSPHLHFPHVVHLKAAGPHYDDPWDASHHQQDLIRTASVPPWDHDPG